MLPEDQDMEGMFAALQAKYQEEHQTAPPPEIPRVPVLSDQLVLEAAGLMNSAANIMATGNGIAAVFALQTAQCTAMVALVEAVHEFTHLFQTIGSVERGEDNGAG